MTQPKTTATTTVSANAGFSISVGIADVKADLGVSVSKTFASGTTVTSQLSIPAHKGGTLVPKAQFTKFTESVTTVSPQCKSTTRSVGTLTGLTKAPYFASCVGADDCTPTP